MSLKWDVGIRIGIRIGIVFSTIGIGGGNAVQERRGEKRRLFSGLVGFFATISITLFYGSSTPPTAPSEL